MRVKFRGKTIDISNQSSKKNEFFSEWNYFTINILENDKMYYRGKMQYWKEHRYYVIVQNPMGSCIVDGAEASTQSKCLQIAFDNIDSDLLDMESMVTNKDAQEMEDVKEVEDWLSRMKY